jgi:hypothetical protein
MKKIFLSLVITSLCAAAIAQDFNKNLASARTAYSGGDLENSRFAMQQMLNDLDVIIGKEVLKMLPAKFDTYAAIAKNDNVTANTGFAGVAIHRDYGTEAKMVKLDIMGNSPLVGSLNAILALPFVGNSSDGSQKQIKVQGYKGILQKNVDSETNKTEYTVQIPLNSSLLTLVVPDSNEAEATKFANMLPVQQIAKMVQ